MQQGVEDAVRTLGNGFLQHPGNENLHAALQRGTLTPKDYFCQLLRLVYRLIFLLAVEERGLLHPPSATRAAKELYARRYGLQRLRARSVEQKALARRSDLWENVNIVFRGVATGDVRLGLPPLAGIFMPRQCTALEGSKIENRHVLTALFCLSWRKESSGLVPVNWRDMVPEEFGGMYESLLELVPQITRAGREFTFATGAETKGNTRKTTGSYYTPDSLVQVLLDSALEPVVQSTLAAHPENATEALLQLAIVDPACGSGHFLLAAARRLGWHVARSGMNGPPSTEQYRQALRDVVERCLYGVDSNPMAVELCKMSLWMEAAEAGKPLTFVDSHIREGNALLGATPELMRNGIPDAAWGPIEGDHSGLAKTLKKKNRHAAAAVDPKSCEDERFVADAWCAAFVWPKQAGELQNAAPTNDLWVRIKNGQGEVPALTRQTVEALALDYQFFHWHLAFPEVFARGGFDVVLGNPPWDQVQLDAREWFAARAPDITNAMHHAARTDALANLQTSEPALHNEYVQAKRRNEGIQHFVHASGRYARTSHGRLNTASLFAETATTMTHPNGICALIVPTGIATDSFTGKFFRYLVQSERLHELLSFENEAFLFPAVHHSAKFSLLVVGGVQRTSPEATLVFFTRHVAQLREPERRVRLAAADFELLNPNTSTCPTFRWRRDAALNRHIYRHAGVLVREQAPGGDPWSFRGFLMFMMNTDSKSFRTRTELAAIVGSAQKNGPEVSKHYLPLLEAKMVHQFDHRFGDYCDKPRHSDSSTLPAVPIERLQDPHYAPTPRYWVSAREMHERLADKWERDWLLGWRDISNATNTRTVIATIIPRTPTGDTFLLAMPAVEPALVAALYANFCSFVFDYAARQKVGGTHLKFHLFKQLPALPPSAYLVSAPWARETLVRDWIVQRVLELTYTAWDLAAFGRDVGYEGPPFRWNPERRFLLRAELDAAFFHLYGLSRDDSDYILETFPIVRKTDMKTHGEYRTKRVILELYDALEEAMRPGRTYETRLDPRPADPCVAHSADPAGQAPEQP